MLIVDTHCHASLGWFEPIERLVAQMDANEVQHAALIQIRGQFDNTYQRECQQRYPGRFSSVVLVDHRRPDAVAALEREAELGAVGLRLGADARSPGDDPLAIWRAAERLGLTVSVQPAGGALASPAFAALARELPRLKLVLEHLAGLTSTQHGRTPESAADHDPGHGAPLETVLGLAALGNVYVKLPGLGEFCRRAMPVDVAFPFVQPIPPLIDRFYGAFGPTRLMWGSDFPPVSNREGYRNALRLVIDQLSGRSAAEREQLFGHTALEAFPVHR